MPSYVVVPGIGGLVCDCARGGLGRGLCKHDIAAADMRLSGRWAAMHGPERVAMRRPAIRCPANASHRPVRDGRLATKRKGDVQRYLCRDCGKRRAGLPGLGRRHASAATISDAISPVSKVVSPERVAGEVSPGAAPDSTAPPYAGGWQRTAPSWRGAPGRPAHGRGTGGTAARSASRYRVDGAYPFTVMDRSTRFDLSYTWSRP